MKLGLQVPNFTWSSDQGQLGDTFATIAERAERAGLYSFWVMDHFFQLEYLGPPDNKMLEGWSALAFAAGRTNRIKLGTLVTGVTYRHPGILVKTTTTLDVLSHGRAYFGIGAAWNEAEHKGLGVPFPPLKERFERLEETLQIALRMWAGDARPFEGKHYRLERPLNSPQAVQQPHPPILIGGSGERKTLRLVAQYADWWCADIEPVEVFRHKARVLAEHCAAVGRDPAEIVHSQMTWISVEDDSARATRWDHLHIVAGNPDEVTRELEAYRDAGVQHFQLRFMDYPSPAGLERFVGKVLPRLTA